jgi:alpha-tubulin suppressor-like RCC1 family protein
LVLKSDGTVWTWGLNTNGRLGDNTTTQRTTPVQVLSGKGAGIYLENIADIAVGDSHSLALTNDGKVYAWGLNTNGQLGELTTVQKLVPEEVRTENDFLEDIVKISASRFSSYAISENGTGYVWGRNTNGELGVGDNTDKLYAVRIKNEDNSDNLTNVVEIQGGLAHTVILRENGDIYTVGLNNLGQLGTGNNTNSNLPVKLTNTLLNDIVQINAGKNYTIMLKENGYVVGFGESALAELGRRAGGNPNYPVYCGVSLKISPKKSVVAKNEAVQFAGEFESFFNIKPEVAVPAVNAKWTVSNEEISEINANSGLFAANDLGLTQVTLTDLTYGITEKMDINILENGSGIVKPIVLSLENGSSVALKSDGTVWAWGKNEYGQLGQGNTTNSEIPLQVKNSNGVDYLTDVAEIKAGIGHIVALKLDGTVWTWGFGTSGQLGNGTTVNSSLPVKVEGLSGVASVGTAATSSFAVMPDGTVYGWGYNGTGVLGDGTRTGRTTPYKTLYTNVIQIEGGIYF